MVFPSAQEFRVQSLKEAAGCAEYWSSVFLNLVIERAAEARSSQPGIGNCGQQYLTSGPGDHADADWLKSSA